MSLVGSRLPTPYYEYTQDARIRVPTVRVCTICGYHYPTMEVPISDNWSGSLAYACYIHYYPGHIREVSGIERVRLENKPVTSRGLQKALAFGGYYRRRYCELCMTCGHNAREHRPHQGCLYPNKLNLKQHRRRYPEARIGEPLCACTFYTGCRNEHGKETGWSTVEVAPEGIVVEDITKCTRCGGAAGTIRPTLNQRMTRHANAVRAAMEIQLDPPSYYRPLLTYRPSTVVLGD